MSSTLLETNTPIFSLKESHRFIKECILALGVPENPAQSLADSLVEADYRGHYSHGMNRLGMYITEIQQGLYDIKAIPEVLRETPATAWVDGHNGIGAAIGQFCMDLAIKKARDVGVGLVTVKRSNHFGIAGSYTLQALKEGLIGLSFTNSLPVVAPTRTNIAAYGTNPLSCAAPAINNDSFVLDMATSAVAKGKIEMKERTNSPLPPGWVHEDTEALFPLGGNEKSSGYKGYGLGILVEILSATLSGAAFGPSNRGIFDNSKLSDLGQCFIAVNPRCFAPDFEERLSDLLNFLRNMEPANPDKPVLIPGDPERLHMAAVDKAGGIRYVQDQLNSCKEFAKSLNVKPLQPLH